MVLRTYTVAFQGAEAAPVEVQCALSPGLPGVSIVGLPDKAVSEAKERVRAALANMRIALPSKRFTINLSPADMPKAGSHYDLPIALAMLGAMQVIPADVAAELTSLGELSLDGRLVRVAGALPAALSAATEGRALLCPEGCAPEAAWVEDTRVIGVPGLMELVRHLTGKALLPNAEARLLPEPAPGHDLREVRGHERAKRALEIAAAGRHHLLMIGPPGAGKSMLAKCLPGLLPPLSAAEMLETSMIHSVAGRLSGHGLCQQRPFEQPHHSASAPSITGGGRMAGPGAISLAHNGVLFLDEMAEFPPSVLDQLRQPMENGTVVVSRALAHVSYPARFLLVAAANPCRCGHLADAGRACGQAPLCSQKYLSRISGPLMDRIDLRLEVPEVSFDELERPPEGDSSATVRARVTAARVLQAARHAELGPGMLNADLQGAALDAFAAPDAEGRALLRRAGERFNLSPRGYHRLQRVARTIADLDGHATITRQHIAEAVSYRILTLAG
ncbi:YifB family Mg chelatase-like AAA ATPase [Pseudooceanicola sp. CBS1P-1]|uniref:YifB family Mg chelatase-like AAA ATPase n=1 Tax=Pseudooceanicola albus TaxID=2692189 RepID=A0A6L7G256_9RHOB|nr:MULTISPECIES: YifB family Mg chelatase-like AAA ATPase [Pseudooceanicola]MBT9384914.1 YifB family Mg chelatase-like AAA ATPase [Pseudooceanicola endophyticus]MXN18091.1 YifB family Mg chelatase-like AAA ATPase [Pseudooceanicola albus]